MSENTLILLCVGDDTGELEEAGRGMMANELRREKL